MKRKVFCTMVLVVFTLVTGVGMFSYGTASAEEILPRCGDGYCDWQERTDPSFCPKDCGIPHYFLAVHNEPSGNLGEAFKSLKRLVKKADEYNMKLTLMFTPPWSKFILSEPRRILDFKRWIAHGHEIAGHHHGIWHGSWDGFTYLSPEEALAIRQQMGKSEPYVGDLDAYTAALEELNPLMHSGCMNDEKDKNEIPDRIIYDACSGFANFGAPGRRLSDTFGGKGVNEYVSVGTVNGIQRKWLTHAQVTNSDSRERAARTVLGMHGGAYGAVTHSIDSQVDAMISFMDLLHKIDPAGAKSRTMSEIIDEKLLPEVQLPAELQN